MRRLTPAPGAGESHAPLLGGPPYENGARLSPAPGASLPPYGRLIRFLVALVQWWKGCLLSSEHITLEVKPVSFMA